MGSTFGSGAAAAVGVLFNEPVVKRFSLPSPAHPARRRAASTSAFGEAKQEFAIVWTLTVVGTP
jgi:hypothetical protein